MERGEEQRLIRKAASGSSSAIEALVRAHQAALYAFVLRMTGRPEAAEDVVQESFVRVIANIQRFDTRFRFSTWLFTIARRLYLNAVQKAGPGFDTDAVERRTSGDAGALQHLSDRDSALQRGRALERALAVLSAEQREVVLLFHQHEWPIKAIVDHMHIPEGTVKSHLHRARRALRQAMEPLDGELWNDRAPARPGSGSSTSTPGGGSAQSQIHREAPQESYPRDHRLALVPRIVRTEVRL